MADYRPTPPKLQQQDLKGKVALVTGATKGIGRAISLDLSTRGASVLGTYSSTQSAHNFDTLTHTVHDLYRSPNDAPHAPNPSAPKLKGIAADITSPSTTDSVISTLEQDFNRKLDILVLNAAINLRPRIGTASDSDITASLTGNLHWPILLMEKLVSKKLFNPNARIVVISSDPVRSPGPGSAIFNATKAGLESLAQSWAAELPLTFPGTTVNAVSVGLTDTPGLRGFPAEAVDKLKGERLARVKVVERGRMGWPEDVADVVGWLVSEKSRWQTGSVVAANGGAELVGGPS